MALTNIQREVCRVLAKQRIISGESYVAGGAALNTLLDAPRVSQDLDLFHDTAAALTATWSADRAALLGADYEIEVIREHPTFVEAIVRRGTESVVLQWTHEISTDTSITSPSLWQLKEPVKGSAPRYIGLSMEGSGKLSCGSSIR
jgi:hypothetical protein